MGGDGGVGARLGLLYMVRKVRGVGAMGKRGVKGYGGGNCVYVCGAKRRVGAKNEERGPQALARMVP